MKGQISASLMCVDFLNAHKDLDALADAGVEYLHFDIMDGSFVPNYTFGPGFVDALRDQTGITFDIHFMVDRPEDKIGYFDIRAGDFVSVHAEATAHLQRLLAQIKDMGACPGVGINPATPVSTLEYVLEDLDFVLVMTVNPGFTGQKLIPQTIKKITQVRNMLCAAGMGEKLIQVDGNVNLSNVRLMCDAGADIFVLGTSGLFLKDMSIQQAAAKMRERIG